jgi:hypothetical protein
VVVQLGAEKEANKIPRRLGRSAQAHGRLACPSLSPNWLSGESLSWVQQECTSVHVVGVPLTQLVDATGVQLPNLTRRREWSRHRAFTPHVGGELSES